MFVLHAAVICPRPAIYKSRKQTVPDIRVLGKRTALIINRHYYECRECGGHIGTRRLSKITERPLRTFLSGKKGIDLELSSINLEEPIIKRFEFIISKSFSGIIISYSIYLASQIIPNF